MILQTCMTYFLLLNTKGGVFKNDDNHTALVTIDFHYMDLIN